MSEEHDIPQEGGDNASELTAEDRALSMGWTPKEQFKGDPEKWVDADTFVKRGEEFLPFLRANNKRLEQALERSNKRFDAAERALKNLSEHHTKTEQRAYERALKELQGQIDTAATLGDVSGVRSATEQLVKLTQEVQAPAADNGSGADSEAEALFEEWRSENPWFDRDAAMRGAALEIARDLDRQGVSGKRRGEEVTARIKAEFPHKFENQNRNRPAAVEGSGSAPRKGGKSFSDLPADAKEMALDFEKRGIMKRDVYAKEYFA